MLADATRGGGGGAAGDGRRGEWAAAGRRQVEEGGAGATARSGLPRDEVLGAGVVADDGGGRLLGLVLPARLLADLDAEALAEYWHHRIRTEWGFVDEDGPTVGGLFRQQYRGGRYSWGYPACPDLEDNATVARLLGAERLGIEVSEETGWQYQPEQTTSALICHHPRAKYFVAR